MAVSSWPGCVELFDCAENVAVVVVVAAVVVDTSCKQQAWPLAIGTGMIVASNMDSSLVDKSSTD